MKPIQSQSLAHYQTDRTRARVKEVKEVKEVREVRRASHGHRYEVSE